MTFIITSAAAGSSRGSSQKRPEWNAFLTDASRFKLSKEEEERRQQRAQIRPPPRKHWRLQRHTSHHVTPPPKFVRSNNNENQRNAADLLLDDQVEQLTFGQHLKQHVDADDMKRETTALARRLDTVEALLEAEKEARHELEQQVLALTEKLFIIEQCTNTKSISSPEPPTSPPPPHPIISQEQALSAPIMPAIIVEEAQQPQKKEEESHPAVVKEAKHDDVILSTPLW